MSTVWSPATYNVQRPVYTIIKVDERSILGILLKTFLLPNFQRFIEDNPVKLIESSKQVKKSIVAQHYDFNKSELRFFL